MSISAQDLRIGNWVYDTRTVGDRTGLPEVLHPMQIEYLQKREYRYLKPIPLTPELLIKCGFEKDEDESKHQCWHLRIGYNEWDQDFFIQLTDPADEIDMCIIYSRDNPESSCQIINFPKYLHQLQNLYFALTNTELSINL